MQRLRLTSETDRRSSSRCGSAYVLVLSITAIVGVVSFTALHNVRILRRDMLQSNDAQEATWLAFSGMENAMARLKSDSNWRTTYTNSVEIAPVTFGRGTFSWRLVDTDGNLADDINESVRVISTGRVGVAARVFSQDLYVSGQSYDVLQTAVHCSGNLTVDSTTIWGGAFSSTGTISVRNRNEITGNGQGVIVQGGALSIAGTLVNGTSATFTPAKAMPNSSVFDIYKARATTIDFWSRQDNSFDGKILSATSNPWGTPNADGIYYIRIPYQNNRLVIGNCRIKATLLIEIEEKGTLDITAGVIWEPPAPNLPSMIAKGLSTVGVDVQIDGSGELNEATWGVNFNPVGLNYWGSENSNMTDTHSPLLRGLFHVIRLPGDTAITTLKGGMTRKGCFLISGNAEITGSSFMNDPALVTDAPQGYVSIPTMRPATNSASWDAAP